MLWTYVGHSVGVCGSVSKRWSIFGIRSDQGAKGCTVCIGTCAGAHGVSTRSVDWGAMGGDSFVYAVGDNVFGVFEWIGWIDGGGEGVDGAVSCYAIPAAARRCVITASCFESS